MLNQPNQGYSMPQTNQAQIAELTTILEAEREEVASFMAKVKAKQAEWEAKMEKWEAKAKAESSAFYANLSSQLKSTLKSYHNAEHAACYYSSSQRWNGYTSSGYAYGEPEYSKGFASSGTLEEQYGNS